MSSKHHKIKVGISVGDFNGIGVEIILKALNDKNITDFLLQSFSALENYFLTKNVFKIQANFNYIQHPKEAATDKLNIVNLWKDNVNVDFGTPTEESTKMAIDSLEAATNALMNGDIDVLVTAPINKDEMMKQGFKHAGHTGYFEEKFNKKGLMFLVTENLKLLFPHHIPVSEIAKTFLNPKLKNK